MAIQGKWFTPEVLRLHQRYITVHARIPILGAWLILLNVGPQYLNKIGTPIKISGFDGLVPACRTRTRDTV